MKLLTALAGSLIITGMASVALAEPSQAPAPVPSQPSQPSEPDQPSQPSQPSEPPSDKKENPDANGESPAREPGESAPQPAPPAK